MPRKSTSTGKPKQLSVREKAGVYRATQPLPRIEQFDLLAPDQLKEITTFASVANQGYAIYICNTPKLREDLIVGLTDNLKAEGVGLYQVRMRSEDKSLGAKIRTLLQNEEVSQFGKKYQKVVVSIVGLDETIQEEEKKFEKRPAALQSLNQQRDYLRTLPFPLLIWIPEWLVAKLPEFAPDFWVARSIVFECLTPSEMMKQSLSQISGVEITYENLNEAKRKMRIYGKIIKSSGDKSIKVFALLNLGILHQMQGDYSKAESLYKQSLRIAEGLGDKSGIAKNLHQLGMIKQDTGNYTEAEKLYRESLKIEEELGDKLGVASSLHQLGMINYLTCNYSEAEKFCWQSLKMKEELGDKSGIARSLHQLGMIKQDAGNYTEAEKLYRESLRIEEELGDKLGVASSLHELGRIKQAMGDYSGAEKLYRESLKIAEELGDKSGIASRLHQLGMIKHDQGDYTGAEKLYRQSLKRFEELGNKSGVAKSLHQLGIIKQDTGEYVEAEKLYRQSLKIEEELGDRSAIAGTIYQLGAIFYERKDYKSALKNFVVAAEIAKKLQLPNLPIALNMIERAKEKLGQSKFQEIVNQTSKSF